MDERQTLAQTAEAVQMAERASEQDGDAQIFAAGEQRRRLKNHGFVVGWLCGANGPTHLLLGSTDRQPLEVQEVRVILEIYATRRVAGNWLEQLFKIDRRHFAPTRRLRATRFEKKLRESSNPDLPRSICARRRPAGPPNPRNIAWKRNRRVLPCRALCAT